MANQNYLNEQFNNTLTAVHTIHFFQQPKFHLHKSSTKTNQL